MLQANIQMPNTKTIISTATSAAAAVVLIRTVARDYLPSDFQHYITRKIRALFSMFSSQTTIVINDLDGMVLNQLFQAAELYLGTKISPFTQRFRATLPVKEAKILLSMDKNQEVIDMFNGAKLVWRRVTHRVDSRHSTHPGAEIRFFELSFHKKHTDMVLTNYFQHILQQSKELKKEKKTPKLHALNTERYRSRGYAWQSVNLDHPATFGTLAIDVEMKKMIMEDLERFVKRKDFYKKVGKAWKRGYLLFGPPGTGKSSLIAAMANYLNFDIYDLELTDVRKNSDLRKLLIATENRSILVVEDIDCSIDLQNRMKQPKVPHPGRPEYFEQGNEVTLSGLLNFMDGLWSSCGDERIIVFTTNHKDRLDPALLRPGRMDVHIHMSYCTLYGLKTLISNYLGITEHPLLAEVEQLIQMAKVTPAEVGEQLMKNEDSEIALRGLIGFLIDKKRSEDLRSNQQKEAAEAKSEKEEENIRIQN